jgi:hypothetical protein
VSRSGEGAPDDKLRRPGVDEAEGAEEHGGPGSQRNPAALHPDRGEVQRDTRYAPTWRANCRRSLTAGSKFLSDRVSDPDG